MGIGVEVFMGIGVPPNKGYLQEVGAWWRGVGVWGVGVDYSDPSP